ncbi:MAG: 3-deoxy-7-phosphoheptulonate synthase [Myxococcales bacterium]|nr:3-deoxy-7-phosphoheptulonate synthase [Myxococcales bacterium]
MLILMRPDASPSQIDEVMERIRELGFTGHPMPGTQRVAIGVTGNDGAIEPAHFSRYPGVVEAVAVSKPWKQVSREWRPEDTVITLAGAAGNAQFGGGRFGVIAGPCAVENREQLFASADAVKAGGARVLRGGAYKPRTSPYSFQGMKEEGLKLLAEARARTGLPVVTEVVDTANVELVAEYSDMVQVGARNMQNFALLEAVGRLKKPVMLKRGLSATIQEFLMAAEYIIKNGNREVLLCERGIRTFETMTRNTLDLGSIPLIKRLTHLPIIVDPSHGTGDWRSVPALARAALALGADGLMVEVHPDPAKALSDGPQSLTPAKFGEMMESLRAISHVVGLEL